MSRDWTLSRFGPKTVLCVMAAEPEYGPALRSRIQPLITGVGDCGEVGFEAALAVQATPSAGDDARTSATAAVAAFGIAACGVHMTGFVRRPDGIHVWDTDGRQYIEGVAGLWCATQTQ